MSPSADTSSTRPKTNGQTNGNTPSHPDGPATAVSSGVSVNGRPTNGLSNGQTTTTTKTTHIDADDYLRRRQSVPVDGAAGTSPSRKWAGIMDWDSDDEAARFPRLSKPLELMRSSYDCVVIGSGYGGGVAASRMARARQGVCVLERGKERWPGEYPCNSREALEQVHYSGEFAPGWLPKKLVNGGDPTAMYHLIFGNGQNAIVGNGLGGTSLMNANVFLEADKETLRQEAWPEEIRNDPDSLDKYYKKAEVMLEPQQYPEDWPALPKLELLKKQARYLNLADKFKRVRQTTRFHNGPNYTGVEMSPSSLTGQDSTGLNDGSKNSVLVTYLADAWNWGADMFCESEVRYITRAPDREGYIVYFAWHGRNRGHFKANLHGDLMWVHAKKAVFLGAGAIATTEILLRSREMGLDLSDQIGQNMSGNGDILGFGYNVDEEVNAIGQSFPSPYRPIGPTITGIIDNREGHRNPLDGYVIEEGAVPRALAPFFQAVMELLPGSIEPEGESLVERVKANLARAGSFFLGPYYRKGAIQRTQVYLIMSHDSNQAILHLKDDKPVLEFLGVGRSDHVKYLNGVLERATKAVGGTFVQNPFYALMGKQQVTVHPIGGACMSSDGTGAKGCTNHFGEVFTGEGFATHPGLIVTDAAVIPTALGANPFATITALAERSVEHYAQRKGLKIRMDKNDRLNLFGSPQHLHDPHSHRRRRLNEDENEEEGETKAISSAKNIITSAQRLKDAGFGFTEVMSGFIHHGEAGSLERESIQTYELAERVAEARCESARFFLSVQSFNTRAIVNDPKHRAMLTGSFSCPTIPGSPFMVQRGDFNLFRQDWKAPGTKNLVYNFCMRGTNGKRLHFRGFKVVDSSVALAPLEFWRATSTLYVTITEPLFDGDSSSDEDHLHHLIEDKPACMRGKVIAKGIMRIQMGDFASQVLTLTPTGSSIFKKAVSAANFLTYFTRKSISLFLTPLTPLQYPTQSSRGYINDTPPSHIFSKIEAEDGVVTRMYVWEPTNTEIETKNLFMIPGASVDHQIYALPTIEYNAVNYFTRAGYRVFIPVHRIGALMVAKDNWTTFDARLDLKACLEKIREEYDKEPIYTIAHCMGSVAFATGLLDGTIPASWIKGVTASQVFMNPIWNTMNMIKILAMPIALDKLYSLVAGSWFSCTTSRDDALVQKALNELLRLMPAGDRSEMCNSAACHRVSLTFARCWNHRNLNEATHRQIDRFFGGVNMTLLHLLMRQGRRGCVMSNAPLFTCLDTPGNIERLRGLPFLLFVGRDNAVLSPESTERTYERLCDAFGTHNGHGGNAGSVAGAGGLQYKRRVVPDYGHLDCWMGRNAWRDVYPFVREEVDSVVRGADYVFVQPEDVFKEMVDCRMLD